MASEWDTHTSLTAAGDGLFGAELDPGWVVGGGVNGGYLLGVIGRAVAEAVPAKPHPLAVSAYYLSASRPGSGAGLHPRAARGRRVATVAAELGQEGDHPDHRAGDVRRPAGDAVRRGHHRRGAQHAADRGVRPGDDAPPRRCAGWRR